MKALYEKLKECSGISTDSRSIINGSMFFALRGDNFDGNKFARQALDKGAKYAVIDNPDFQDSDKMILTDDVLTTLQEMAGFHRKQMKAKLIAITGSNGKTTTKELIHASLSSHYNTLSTIGNLNNHIGVPLTLLRITEETEYAIIEMGANHIGEIARLCEIADPDYGLITNVGQAHLEGFGSFEGVKKAKSELYKYLRHRGVCFINKDNQHLLSMIEDQKTISYAFKEKAWCKANLIREDGFAGLHWKCDKKSGHFISRLRGTYNGENLLAAVCVASYMGVPAEKTDTALAGYIPSNRRSEIRKTKRNTLFLDMYNANPSSMLLAIKDFVDPFEKQALILGDMKELGETSDELHNIILEVASKLEIDKVFLSGPEFYKHRKKYPFDFYPTTPALKSALQQSDLSGYHIMIKGSRSMVLEQVIETL
ncbi:MAG: UDP-N-acetylmuramoyl-tripeptide--D-alanyl-D-alanine ligase [Bacteroidales bacterium]